MSDDEKRGVFDMGRSFDIDPGSVRSATRAAEQKRDVPRAQETVEAIQADREALEAERQTEIDRITEELPDDVKVTEYDVKPRKSDTTIDAVS